MQKKSKIEGGVLAALVVILGLTWYFAMRPAPTPATANSTESAYAPLAVQDPELHWHKWEAARNTRYEKSARDIFSEKAPPPETPAPVPPTPNPGPVEPPKPVVSPLPVKFYGYGVVPTNGARLAFFTNGDDVFIVGEGETLLGRFRILRIGNTNLEYEELSSGLRGTANLEEDVSPSA